MLSVVFNLPLKLAKERNYGAVERQTANPTMFIPDYASVTGHSVEILCSGSPPCRVQRPGPSLSINHG
jgi:hypothetical protein